MLLFSHHARTASLVLIAAALSACADRSNPTESASHLLPRRSVGPGAVIVVTTTNDGLLAGTLRSAVNQTIGGEVIHFDPSIAGAKITLDTTLDIPNNITIEGPADKGMIISGGGKHQVFHVHEGATFANLTITEGKAINNDIAGGILSTGPVVIDHSTLTGNTGGDGAAIRGNDITLTNSTVANNSAEGGFDVAAGINYDFNGRLTLINSTVAHNTKGAGIAAFGGGGTPVVTLTNSIISNNEQGDCNLGTRGFVYIGVNIIDDKSCGTPEFTVLITDPLVASTVADNGGPTPTLALDHNSPAINGTDCTLAVDQRFVKRDAHCDIGAFEFVFTTIALKIDPTGQVDRTTGAITVTGTLQCSRAENFDLAITIDQNQKVHNFPTNVNGTKNLTVSCQTTAQPWIVSIQPPSGQTFLNGDATVSAQTVNIAKGVFPSSASTQVKLFWSQK
jgi:hypothetical protein